MTIFTLLSDKIDQGSSDTASNSWIIIKYLVNSSYVYPVVAFIVVTFSWRINNTQWI